MEYPEKSVASFVFSAAEKAKSNTELRKALDCFINNNNSLSFLLFLDFMILYNKDLLNETLEDT
jgi:hypothetical protein